LKSLRCFLGGSSLVWN